MTRPMVVAQAELMRRSEGRAIVFTSRASLAGDLMRFDFSWFMPPIVKYLRIVLEVVMVSMPINVELGARLFRQLLALPLGYFAPAGSATRSPLSVNWKIFVTLSRAKR